MPTYLLPFLLLAWPFTAAAAERPLTAAEARAAVQSARTAPPPAGCWQRVEVREEKRIVTTETVTELREPGRPTLRRIETERRSERDGKTSRTVRLMNSEGNWMLRESAAIRVPPTVMPAEMKATLEAGRERARQDLERMKQEGRLSDPASREEMIARYGKFSGARIEHEDGTVQLRVRIEFGPETRKMMRAAADAAWKEKKKELSLGARLIAGSVYAAKRDDFLPVAQESLLDGATGALLEQQLFNEHGKPIEVSRGKRTRGQWERVEPVAGQFEVPATLRRLTPQTREEYDKLLKEHRGAPPSSTGPSETGKSADPAPLEKP